MNARGYRHLPVMQNGRVVGIVSSRDFYGEEKAEEEKAAPTGTSTATPLRN